MLFINPKKSSRVAGKLNKILDIFRQKAEEIRNLLSECAELKSEIAAEIDTLRAELSAVSDQENDAREALANLEKLFGKAATK